MTSVSRTTIRRNGPLILYSALHYLNRAVLIENARDGWRVLFIDCHEHRGTKRRAVRDPLLNDGRRYPGRLKVLDGRSGRRSCVEPGAHQFCHVKAPAAGLCASVALNDRTGPEVHLACAQDVDREAGIIDQRDPGKKQPRTCPGLSWRRDRRDNRASPPSETRKAGTG